MQCWWGYNTLKDAEVIHQKMSNVNSDSKKLKQTW